MTIRTPLAPQLLRRRLRGAHAYRPVMLETSMLCRVCTARDGIASAFLDARFQTIAEHDEHFRREHPEWC